MSTRRRAVIRDPDESDEGPSQPRRRLRGQAQEEEEEIEVDNDPEEVDEPPATQGGPVVGQAAVVKKASMGIAVS